MIVKEINRSKINDHTENIEKGFFGITCQWYNSKLELQTEIFNTKDIIKL